jgi:hypothetical protein
MGNLDRYTMADWAKGSNDSDKIQFVKAIHESGNIKQFLTFRKSNALASKADVLTDRQLKPIGYGRLDKDPTEFKGDYDKIEGYVIRVNPLIKADRAYHRAWKENPRGPGPVDQSTNVFFESWAKSFNDNFINGTYNSDGSVNHDGPKGVRRIMSDATLRAKYLIPDDLFINANVNYSPGSVSVAGTSTIIEKLMMALDYMSNPTGQGVLMLMSTTLRSRLAPAFASAGFLDETTDAYDRRIQTFMDAKLISPGFKPQNGAATRTEIMPTFETTGGLIGTSGTDKRGSIILVDTRAKCMDNFMGGDESFKELAQVDNNISLLLDSTYGFQTTSPMVFSQIYNIQVEA